MSNEPRRLPDAEYFAAFQQFAHEVNEKWLSKLDVRDVMDMLAVSLVRVALATKLVSKEKFLGEIERYWDGEVVEGAKGRLPE